MPNPRPTIVAGLLAVAIALALVPMASAASTSLEAEAMSVSPSYMGNTYTDSTASGGIALGLWGNSSASTNVSIPAAKGVVVRAMGQSCKGAPSMTISMNGTAIGTGTVSATSWTDYTATASIPAGTYTLTVAYTNDYRNGSCDRNLLLDKVTVLTSDATPAATTVTAPFAADSPWRTSIPAAAPLDPNSAAMVSRGARTGGVNANLVAYGVPIYRASADSPRYTVRCTITSWGRCPFDGYQVPIPAGAGPNTGSDAAMVIIDESTRKVFEFWQAKRSGSQWTASWGAVNDLDGSGWGGSSTGSGASRLAGVIRVAEIQQGAIPHALALQSDNVCARVFRAPAIKTDGQSTRSDCVPEGARLRLDPAVDLNALNLTSAERTVARALQVYGAYIIDAGAAPLSVSFELDPTASGGSIGSTYQQAGLRWDYDDMRGIPWNRLQVLR
ncbi:carbohydrate-binding domain-containing protein [Mycobacterium sp. 155]|uniref:carbohydrate-binding domain-containing protein n=1 Tax=Mycobacterium sp. 155 TaxID=1157943 RepID=UPI0003787E79|nr:carbohydrate-binding domain-containing protein [Mycobacterium sp. 155]